MANDLTARWAALAFLENILEKHMPLDQAFEQTCQHFEGRLSEQDRGFVRHLGTTCLRRLGQLDAMINHCTPRKLTGQQKIIRNILRLGISQLLYMAVPSHGAVNTAVKMCDKQKNTSHRHAKGMVNAILRRIDRERDKFSTSFLPELNLPKWLKKNWQDRYGADEVANICAALLGEPPLDISLKPQCKGTDWAEKLGGKLLPGGSVRVEKAGSVPNLPGYDEGAWWVQDVAASLPAILLGARQGDHVLDLCAAPGGKTAQLVARGCQVTALDRSARRLRRLSENMDRLSLNCDVVTSDVADYRPEVKFSHILLDAPCSALGTLRRHPEASRRQGPKDITALAEIQSRLLDAAVALLSVGGILIYCVCSLQREEGPDQIKALLERYQWVKRKAITAHELPGFERSILSKGDVQTLPHQMTADFSGGMDGFFISRLIKI